MKLTQWAASTTPLSSRRRFGCHVHGTADGRRFTTTPTAGAAIQIRDATSATAGRWIWRTTTPTEPQSTAIDATVTAARRSLSTRAGYEATSASGESDGDDREHQRGRAGEVDARGHDRHAVGVGVEAD